MFLWLAPLGLLAQDCADPAPLCFEQFNNIQADTTSNGPLTGQFSCGEAFNGSLYEITTVAAGEFSVVVENISCDAALPTEGDSLIVELFTSSTPATPCAPGSMSLVDCQSSAVSVTLTSTAIAAGETYFVVVYGDMDADDTDAADCGYDLQVDGQAVRFFMDVPPSPITILAGQQAEIEGVSGVEEYLWQGPGLITEDTLANPTIFPGTEGTFDYLLTGTQGDCQVSELITIIVTPNIVPADIVTPNADGFNDVWYIQFLDARYERAQVQVFDRWGQRVFNSIGYGPGREWDGTNNGNRVPVGAYFYVIDLNLEGQETEPFTGDISILY